MFIHRLLITLLFFTIFISCKHEDGPYEKWNFYGGTPENIHYSTLSQIDTNNVTSLKPVWTYHSKDLDSTSSQLQVNSIIIDSILYGVSPKLKLFALSAATGTEKWTFDPFSAITNAANKPTGFAINACRGVTYFDGGKDDKKIFYTAASLLYCIDAISGKPVKTFGTNGSVDLHNDLGRDVSQLYITSTTPGVIYHDLIIIPTRVAEDASAAPGHIRAFDVHTGKVRWTFHTIPYPGEPGYETWDDPDAYKHIGGANVWAGFTLDKRNGILYAPVGSASFDFYGGKRLGQNLYANCIVALEAETGKHIWHFQTVHHDVWDRDPSSPPALVSIQKDGRIIEAIAQTTKTGFIFLLDRFNGKPIFPVDEKPTPQNSELVGERMNPTQPFPTVFSPFVRQTLLEKDLNNLVPDSSYQDLKRRLVSYKTGDMFNPPSLAGTVIFPGYDGGAEWGGPSFDPSTGLLYVNASEMPWILTMIRVNNKKENKNVTTTNAIAGNSLYQTNCVSCHGSQRQGGGNYPSIVDADKKYDLARFTELLNNGRRMMPAFKQLSKEDKIALASFILNDSNLAKGRYTSSNKSSDPYLNLPYTTTGYNKFLTKEGYPAVMPPWGTLTAINLNSGKVEWKDTLGDYPELKAKGIHSGTENYGGSVVTSGGLLFIAATKDKKFRAFNKRTGKLIWETELPASAFATPSVYKINGKEYIVIACGGGKLGTKSGDAYVAFSLP